jgi:long-chain acyl-CoA synthetase
VELHEETIEHMDAVRDLLREIATEAEAGRAGRSTSPLEQPEEILDERQKRWLKPLAAAGSAAARGMFALNRILMRGPFRLRV